MTPPRQLAQLYSKAHDLMRNIDGLQPQEAFDELLKYMFFKQVDEESLFPASSEETAEHIQKRFAAYVKKRNSWSSEIWKDRKFHLSSGALNALHGAFSEIQFSKIPYDVRAAAMRQFLTPEIRRGLGIYLTPDEVVSEAIAFLAPPSGTRFLDPACGSGTFLIEAARYWKSHQAKQPLTLWATDKNPRMLLLAELNIEHMTGVTFEKRLTDSLAAFSTIQWDSFKEGSFDFVGTNPPFGVSIDAKTTDLGSYMTGRDEQGYTLKRQQSEIVFLERCLQLLKPGGRLAIVLPKSAMSNMRLDHCRRRLGDLGFVYAAFFLPPETFGAYGTQTNTVVLFAERYASNPDKDRCIDIATVTVTNVGYDLTGRERPGNQLPGLHRILQEAMRHGGHENDLAQVFHNVPAKDTFALFSSLGSSKQQSTAKGQKLVNLAEIISTGKTQARSAYLDDGLFILKVGNLTGGGINWCARDRNFVDQREALKRKQRPSMMLQQHDIVMTSSAHSPVYIAKKVDIITTIPKWVGGAATYVGEVLLIRPKQDKINPFSLLAFLRHPGTVDQIQQMVRGQTAHLHPEDLSNLVVPDSVISSGDRGIIAVLKEEATLNERLNELSREQLNYAGHCEY